MEEEPNRDSIRHSGQILGFIAEGNVNTIQKLSIYTRYCVERGPSSLLFHQLDMGGFMGQFYSTHAPSSSCVLLHLLAAFKPVWAALLRNDQKHRCLIIFHVSCTSFPFNLTIFSTIHRVSLCSDLPVALLFLEGAYLHARLAHISLICILFLQHLLFEWKEEAPVVGLLFHCYDCVPLP